MQQQQQQQINPIALSNNILKEITVGVISLVKLVEELTKQNLELQAALQKEQPVAPRAPKENKFKEFDTNIETL